MSQDKVIEKILIHHESFDQISYLWEKASKMRIWIRNKRDKIDRIL